MWAALPCPALVMTPEPKVSRTCVLELLQFILLDEKQNEEKKNEWVST